MVRYFPKTYVLTLALLCCAYVTVATASVQVTVGNWGATSYPGPNPPPSTAPHVLDGLGYPGDTVAFQGAPVMLDLTEGAHIETIGSLLWSIAYTYAGRGDVNDPDAGWRELQFPVNMSYSMSFDGGSSSNVSQSGLLEVNWDNDYLSLYGGSTSTFFVPGYQIDVTPLGIDRTEGSNFSGFPGGTPWEQPAQFVQAEFVVTKQVIPEPMSLIVWSILGSVVGASVWWRRGRN